MPDWVASKLNHYLKKKTEVFNFIEDNRFFIDCSADSPTSINCDFHYDPSVDLKIQIQDFWKHKPMTRITISGFASNLPKKELDPKY